MKSNAHRVLVNRKTGKYASASDASALVWPLLALRLTNRGHLTPGGIVSLLLPKSQKELKRLQRIDNSNKIIKKTFKSKNKAGDIRRKVIAAVRDDGLMANLAVLFHDSNQRTHTIKQFSVWMVAELKDPNSEVTQAFQTHVPKIMPEYFAEKQSAWWERQLAQRRKK